MNELNPKYISFTSENRTVEQSKEIFKQRILDAKDVYEKFKTTFIDRNCPVCGSKGNKIDKFHDTYEIEQCDTCLTKFVNPCPSEEALMYYYNNCECNNMLGKIYNERSKKQKNGGGVILSERTKKITTIIMQLLNKNENLKVLEIGCNSGGFLKELVESLKEKEVLEKVELVGIDIDKNAIENRIISEALLYHSSAEDFIKQNSQKYDLIINFELIEHLPNPKDFITAIYLLLKNDGLLFFSTPNADGLDNIALGYNSFRPLAHGIYPPMHLQAFSTKNIVYFLLSNKFKIKELKTPGNFDVDIIKTFIDDEKSFWSLFKNIDDNTLAIFQVAIKELGASSHMEILASK